MVRDAKGTDRILLDPTALDKGKGKASITIFSVSPDASKVAVNIDRGGNEITRIDVLDVASGKFTGDAVGPVWGESKARWLPDGSVFTYTQMQLAIAKDRAGPHRLDSQWTKIGAFLQAKQDVLERSDETKETYPFA